MSELPRDLDLAREVEHGELAVVLQRPGVASASRFFKVIEASAPDGLPVLPDLRSPLAILLGPRHADVAAGVVSPLAVIAACPCRWQGALGGSDRRSLVQRSAMSRPGWPPERLFQILPAVAHPATQSGFMVPDDAGHWQPGYVGTVP